MPEAPETHRASHEVAPMLVLSTAHLEERTAKYLTENPYSFGSTFYPKGDYGWFVPVPPSTSYEPDIMPECVSDCFALARAYSYEWIMFDRDADPIPELATYNW